MTHIFALFSFFNGMGGTVVTSVPLTAFVAQNVLVAEITRDVLRAYNKPDTLSCGVVDDGR